MWWECGQWFPKWCYLGHRAKAAWSLSVSVSLFPGFTWKRCRHGTVTFRSGKALRLNYSTPPQRQNNSFISNKIVETKNGGNKAVLTSEKSRFLIYFSYLSPKSYKEMLKRNRKWGSLPKNQNYASRRRIFLSASIFIFSNEEKSEIIFQRSISDVPRGGEGRFVSVIWTLP